MIKQVFSHPSKKVIFAGASGTGKTTLFEKEIKRQRAKLIFVFDHQGEFAQRFGHPACHDADGLCAAVERGGFVIFDPCEMYPADIEKAFLFFCDFAFEISKSVKGHKIFACDELQMLVSTSAAPAELRAILQTGRRFQLDFYAITNALNAIHNSIRNQLTEVYAFFQTDTNAIAYLSENGFDTEQIRNLKGFDYLWRNLRTGENNFGGTKKPADNPGGANTRTVDDGGKLEIDSGKAGNKPVDSEDARGKSAA
jgi:hypothetical protein